MAAGNDPSLAGDACFFMEACAGDGGNHSTCSGGTWWLSPDLKLQGPTSGASFADPNPANNIVTLTARRKNTAPTCTTGLSSEISGVNIDLFVYAPQLVPPRITDLVHTKQLPSAFVLIGSLPAGGHATRTVTWQLPASPPAGGPESPGHKCLIARCYPDNGSASVDNLYVPDDPHYVQHNICIVPCPVGSVVREMGARNGGRDGCALNVNTANPNDKEPEMVIIRAVADLHPSKLVLDAALPLLQQVPGFQRIATTAPSGFNMQFPEFPNAKVVDNTRPGCLGTVLGLVGAYKPTYDAQFLMGPGQVSPFFFAPDLSRTPRGEAHIFHITHIGANQRVLGGLTVLAVNP